MRLFRLLPLFLVILSAAGCRHFQQGVPQELLGNWVTDDENYQGKSFEIDQEFIVLFLGEDHQPKAERIDRVSSTSEAGLITYVFETSDKAGVRDIVKVLYRPALAGELRLSNPSQVVWKRAEPPAQ
jgi:hypothetical protein